MQKKNPFWDPVSGSLSILICNSFHTSASLQAKEPMQSSIDDELRNLREAIKKNTC